jgi:photosystem II stability/assembly factor-like uncharacterized protein
VTVAAPPRPPRPDDHEALIEEARRRTRRRRWGYGLALLFVLSGALGLYFGSGHGGGSARTGRSGGGPAVRGPAEEARRIAQVAARTITVDAGLAGPRYGWAMNGLALWWTDDGGHRWRTITPPRIRATGDVVARVTDIAAVDDLDIWVAAADLAGGAAPRHMAIESTRDRGKTWRSVVPPGCEACAGAHLSFVDAERGFALVGARPSPRLFETTDGGATWRRVSSDVSFTGPIRFVDGRIGWGVSDPGGMVWSTRNGGRRWRRVDFVAPRGYGQQPATAGIPHFFDAQDGVVPVRYRSRSDAQHLVVYVTRDSGATWTARPAPRTVDLRAQSWGFPAGAPFSAATIDDWFVFANRDLYTTRDGGRSWASFRTAAPKAPRVWDVAFASPTYGWAIFAPSETGPRAGSALVETSDGGRRWTALAPHDSRR